MSGVSRLSLASVFGPFRAAAVAASSRRRRRVLPVSGGWVVSEPSAASSPSVVSSRSVSSTRDSANSSTSSVLSAALSADRFK